MARSKIRASQATTVESEGRALLFFGGCDYLALAHEPRIVRALADALARYGVSAGASRETTGNASAHEELESALAERLGFEAAALVPEGYLANLAAVQSLGDELDTALIDEKGHPSLFAAAAAAHMEIQAFPHANLEALKSALRDRGPRSVVLSDSVFPTEGEIAPVAALLDATERSGAMLVLDDCHATGVIGASGRGSLEHAHRSGAPVLVTSTLSKALGVYGGFVAGPRERIDALRARSDAYVTTTPIPPALAQAAVVALEIAFENDDLVHRMRANAACLRAGLERLHIAVPRDDLPVFAFTLAPPERMHTLHALLLADGILAPFVRYPGGPPNGNFRVVVNAAHTVDDIERLVDALARHAGAAA